ncbi:unnamed protein product [Musa textilis]
MTRWCSHCSHDGHNSRTCPNRGVKLFDVRLTEGSIRKSASMGNLSILAGCSGGVSPANGSEPGGSAASADGYASEDFTKGYASKIPIMKFFEPCPTASAQWKPMKYTQPSLMNFQESEAQNNKPLPVPPTLNEDFESMDSNDKDAVVPQPEALQCSYHVLLPAYFSPFLQLSFPQWSGDKADTSEQQAHEIMKPTAVHLKTPINVDELYVKTEHRRVCWRNSIFTVFASRFKEAIRLPC